MKRVDILSNRLLFVPVHCDAHWCLAAVDLKQQQFSYYDSLSCKDDTCLQRLRDYIMKKLSLHTVTERPFVYPVIPQQSNQSDYGVFVCMFARYLAIGSGTAVNFNFSQQGMPLVRKHMVIELLAKKIL